MGIKSGKRIIKVVNLTDSWKYGDWYKDLMGVEFTAIMYSIVSAEYTVKHGDKFMQIPERAVEIVSDNSQDKIEINEKYYCPPECRWGCRWTSGDGWNEPRCEEFDCNCPDNTYNDAEFTEDSSDPLCPNWKEPIPEPEDPRIEERKEIRRGINHGRVYSGTDQEQD